MESKEERIFIVQNNAIVDVLPLGKIDNRTSSKKNGEAIFVIDNARMHRICQIMGWHYFKMLD